MAHLLDKVTGSPPKVYPSMVRFVRMNGAGNAILVADERGGPSRVTAEAARRIGQGPFRFDQMMVVSDPSSADVDAAVRIFNIDGSRAGACGNGTRCVAFALLEGSERRDLVLDIDGLRVPCRRDAEFTFTVDMGRPRLGWREVPLRQSVDTDAVDLGPVLDELALPRPVCLSMGNPHAVFFVDDARAIDLAGVGPRLEHHPMFPDRANVSFAEVRPGDDIVLRTWERGAGATLACGSGACATLVAAVRRDLTGRRATVSQRGGDLVITWREDDHVLMTGPVEVEERGTLDLAVGAAA